MLSLLPVADATVGEKEQPVEGEDRVHPLNPCRMQTPQIAGLGTPAARAGPGS